jgi:hypothetical protein
MEPGFRIAIAAAAMAASGASQAQAHADFCAELREVVAAARETPPFASFPNWSTYARPMLAFEQCGTARDYGSLRFLCTRYDPERLPEPPGLDSRESFDRLVSRIEHCLPRAIRARDERPVPNARSRPRVQLWEDHIVDFDLDGLRFRVNLVIRPRFTRLGLEAYDPEARAAFLADRAEEWRRARAATPADARD